MTEERRRFEDPDGNGWEVDPREDFKWHVVPLEGNDGTRKIVTPPPQADDPFELSEEELQRLLESGIPTEGITEPARSG